MNAGLGFNTQRQRQGYCVQGPDRSYLPLARLPLRIRHFLFYIFQRRHKQSDRKMFFATLSFLSSWIGMVICESAVSLSTGATKKGKASHSLMRVSRGPALGNIFAGLRERPKTLFAFVFYKARFYTHLGVLDPPGRRG